MLSILTDMIRHTREQLKLQYGAEMTEEILMACYRDSLKSREVEMAEKAEISKALLKGATKYLMS